jgi:GxxExxY protein
MQPQDQMAKQVIGMAMKVHRTLGCGFVETVYRNALIVELRRSNLKFIIHPELSVTYEGIEVGLFQADLIVENRIIVELKAVDALNTAHSAQLVNYLMATKIDLGLLLNFGARSLEFKTKSRVYQPPDLHS